MKALLQKLNIADVNPGVCIGQDKWISDDNGEKLISYNPATGDPIAAVIQATEKTYNQAVVQAVSLFQTWREIPAPQRGQVIRDLGNAVRELKEPLGDLISLEMGKIRMEGHGEVQEMIDICDFAVGLSRQLYGLTMHSERPGHRMYEQWHPLGPVGVITAFNFPIAVWSWNSTIAAVCGDTVIWKPSEQVPLTAVAMQHICNHVMSDHGLAGLFNLVIGTGPEIGGYIVQDNRIPLVSFTGSTNIGKKIAQSVAGRFGRTILECGGNNAIIVAADANLELATRGILFGSVGTAGQRCTTSRRLVVHKSIASELESKLVNAYIQVKIGDPLDEDILMGPLVSSVAVEGMFQAIEQAVADGGQIIYGGRKRPDLGQNFVEPTIIKMPRQSEIVKQETFAPILYVLEYSDISEAIRIQNDVPQGLSSSIFTDSMHTAEEFLAVSGSDCGIANVNIGTSGAEIGGAFGGEKETGGGRESGSDAWRAYMRRQTNTINWSNDLPLAQGIRFGDH